MSEPALLLPGWGTDPRRLAPMAAALRADGIDAEVWSYRPEGTLDHLAGRLGEHLARSPAPVHLVGHSLGGIVAAAAALRDPEGVTSVTTINAPWRGTWVSFTGQGPLADALRWRSQELSALRDRLEAAEDPRPSWLLLGVLADLATPATTALRAGAHRVRRRVVPGAGHSLCLGSERLVEEVRSHVALTRSTRLEVTPRR